MILKRNLSTKVPEFKIISQGIGSYLRIELNSEAKSVLINPSALVGLSGTAESSAVYDNSLNQMILKRMSGAPLVFTKITSESANVLLAPKSLGEIKTIELNNQSLVFGKPNNILALTEGITIRSGLKETTILGSGRIAFNGFGSLHEINLKADEEYYVDPKNIVAYFSTKAPTPLIYNQIIKIPLPSNSLSSLLQYWLFGVYSRLKQSSYYYLTSLLGIEKKGLYRVGEGNYYIQSRIEPSFDGLVYAYAGLRNQGKVIADAWEHMKSAEPMENESKSEYKVTSVAKITKNGVIFEKSSEDSKKTLKRRRFWDILFSKKE